MDENTLIILQTDINAQMELIKKIHQTLNNRSKGLTAEIFDLDGVSEKQNLCYHTSTGIFTRYGKDLYSETRPFAYKQLSISIKLLSLRDW